jgi:formylglycine-generating enzyme required for sulfatase activity
MRPSILFRNAALALLVLLVADARAVNIAWSPVGNPGNANDPATGSAFGGVAYSYSIDKYDVTVGQYTAFLNFVAKTDTYALYNTSMATDLNVAGIARSGSSGSYAYGVIGSANHPITYVSWGDAARFANWLQNGQPTGAEGAGTTETGAYTLNGAITAAALDAVTRNAGATIFIPSESEWYKAAFYNPNTSSYYQYPFSSNVVPTSAMPGSTPNTGNIFSSTTGYAVTGSTIISGSQNYLTDVGAYTASASPYGAFDMGGNVWQWNETLFFGRRDVRGGSWILDASNLQSSRDAVQDPTSENPSFGFRVASLVPEPSSLVLAALGFAVLVAWRLRRR